MSDCNIPDILPEGTRFVLEGTPGRDGKLRVSARFVRLPDGEYIDLMPAKAATSRNRRPVERAKPAMRTVKAASRRRLAG